MRNQNSWAGILVGVGMGALLTAAAVLAGDLEPIGGPTLTGSQMYTLEQIYNRINNGVAATKMAKFTEPSSGPTAGTMHTLDDIYALAGLRAPVPKTGQTTCYNSEGGVIPCAGTGQDGDLKKGVAWPSPRFADNSNGTVTDNLTGLIWLKNANCFGQRTWAQALSDANTLAAGYCGVTDGSTAGQWRLPNVKELQSLIDWAFFNPALSNAAGTAKWTTAGDAFTGVQSDLYWSSTTLAVNTASAWYVYLNYGIVSNGNKLNPFYVWPVRGGQ